MPFLNGTTESYRIKDLYWVRDDRTGALLCVLDSASHEKYKARSEAAKRGWEKRKEANHAT